MGERIQLRRTKGWRKPEGAIVVSRPSVFGNPAVIECDRSIRNTVNPWHVFAGDVGPGLGWCETERDARALAVKFFREWVLTKDGSFVIQRHADQGRTHAYCEAHKRLHERLPELAGRDLACWCPLDQPCHADVLLEIANASSPAVPGAGEEGR
jgi:hypothetical protein